MTTRTIRALLSASALAVLTLVPAAAQASPDAEEDALRISGAGHALKWNWTPPGKSDRYGHGEVLINASYDRVRMSMLDFGKYKELAPSRFKSSRVVGHENGGTQVYMQFSAMHGLVSLWNVLNFGAPYDAGEDTEMMEGKFVRGNITDSNVIWTIKRVDDDFTVLKCDILLKPDIPAPQSALDEELRDAAQQAVDGVRERAQGNNANVPWSRPTE
jgi:hypothetical protein